MDESAGQREQHATSRGIVIGPGEGRTIPGTDAITLIATAEQTGGSIGVFEDTSSPGTGHPATFTTDRTSCSTYLRESSSSWSGSDKKACRQGPTSSSQRGRYTPTRSSGSSGEGAFGLRPRRTGAGLRGVREVAHRGRRGESERAPKQDRGGDE